MFLNRPPRRPDLNRLPTMQYHPNFFVSEYRLRQREYLLRISRAMTSNLDVESLVELILRSAVELMNCSEGLISIWPTAEAAHRQLDQTVVASIGIPGDVSLFRPLTEVLPMKLVRHDTGYEPVDTETEFVVAWDDVEMRRRVQQVHDRLNARGDGFRLSPEALWRPLHVRGELLGVMYLFRERNAFTPLDRQVLNGFVNQASIAVRNARMYRELEGQRKRLAGVIENSAEGIMILDGERYVISINQSLADLVGIMPEAALNLRCGEVLDLHNVNGFDFCQSHEAVDLPDEESIACEGEIVRPDAKTRAVSVTYTPLRDLQGRLENVIVNVIDITRFREEEELKTTFVSAISHDLKTPVTVIKGNVDLLSSPDARWTADERQDMLSVIAEESDRLEGMINDLLDVSKVAAGAMRLERFPVDMPKLLRSVVQGARLQSRTHAFVLDFPEQDWPVVLADEDKLRQVLANLVGNAIKYAPDGGDIRVGAWVETDPVHGRPLRLVTYVADQGIGIPENELDNIYQSFYRVDRGSNRRTSGTGLGLFLAKSIVDAHDGELWARSALGQGTTFFVALPVAATVEDDVAPLRDVA